MREKSKISRARSRAHTGTKSGGYYKEEGRGWPVPKGDGAQKTSPPEKRASFTDGEMLRTSLWLEDLKAGFPRRGLGKYSRPQWQSGKVLLLGKEATGKVKKNKNSSSEMKGPRIIALSKEMPSMKYRSLHCSNSRGHSWTKRLRKLPKLLPAPPLELPDCCSSRKI